MLAAVGAVAIGALATGATPFGGGLGLTDVPIGDNPTYQVVPAG